MPLRKVLFNICMITSAVSLAAGYGIARQWIWAFVAILMIPAWLFTKKSSGLWLPLICLLASIFIAAMGKINGAPSILMIFGSALSLATWDLLLLNDTLGNDASNEQTRQYEAKHLQSLALALGLGLIAAFIGRLINFRIPFLVLILFIVLFLFGLDRVWGYIKKTGH